VNAAAATTGRPSRKAWLGLVLLVFGVNTAHQWWVGRQQAAVGLQVAGLARAGDIHMLSSDSCAICVVARGWMQENRVPFSECSIERDAACREAFAATRSPGTPVLLVRGQPQVGFDPQRVLQRLQKSS
jgi:glutaredoxin